MERFTCGWDRRIGDLERSTIDGVERKKCTISHTHTHMDGQNIHNRTWNMWKKWTLKNYSSNKQIDSILIINNS